VSGKKKNQSDAYEKKAKKNPIEFPRSFQSNRHEGREKAEMKIETWKWERTRGISL